ncbi:MAG: Trp family transcriptional regulator [Patescibacteria group bacterium]
MEKSNNKINKWLEEYEKGKMAEDALLAKVINQFSEAELPYLFSSIFTKDEMKTFVHRFLIVKKIKEDISQHEIAHKLKVGVATVTRGAKEIQKGKFKFL